MINKKNKVIFKKAKFKININGEIIFKKYIKKNK